MIEHFHITSADRGQILGYLKDLKSEQEGFRIIDVGASLNTWSRDVVDAIVDFNQADVSTGVQVFAANLNQPEDWRAIEDHVEQHGKFDFSICSHTLEDLANPSFVCAQLSRISKAGYVSVPTKYRELSRFEVEMPGGSYRGYIHHRWIFTIRDGRLLGFPKMNFLDVDPYFDAIADARDEVCDLSFIWKDSIEMDIVNGDFLGPDALSVIQYYRQLLINDDLDVRLDKAFTTS